MSFLSRLTGTAALPATPAAPKAPTLASLIDFKRGVTDDAGYLILDIYARKPPDYAVYSNEQRVAIQFADRPSQAADQRKMMSGLNPLRGEINGLINGWRYAGPDSGRKRKALRYDRRVADSLIAALEGDAEGGRALLERIRQDIIDERTASARLQYVAAALGVGVLAVFAIALLRRFVPLPEVARDLFAASVAGAFGAFFSIALAMRNRTVLLDLLWLANLLDALLRMVIGLVAAGVLMAMVDAGLVNVSFGNLRSSPADARLSLNPPPNAPAPQAAASGDVPSQAAGAPTQPTPAQPTPAQPTQAQPPPAPPPDAATTDAATTEAPAVVRTLAMPARTGDAAAPGGTWLQILLIGFVAGFSERFVPDLLAKATATAPTPVPVVTAQAAPSGTPPPPPDQPKPDAASPEDDAGEEHDAEAHADGCPGGAALAEDEVTPDTLLPAASGGVAPAAPAKAA